MTGIMNDIFSFLRLQLIIDPIKNHEMESVKKALTEWEEGK